MKYYLGILLILISFSLKAQAQSNLTANNILKTRGEVYFSFKKPNHLDLKQLSKLLSVDDVKENIVFAYANAHEFQEFSKLNIEYSLVEEYYNKSRAVNMASSIADMQNWDKYPTYQLYVEMMHKFAQDYPNYCRVDTIGTSAGYDMLLLSLIISNNIEDFGEKPLFFWTGTMHGDETLGYILLLRFADYLLSNYGSNTEITNLLDNAVIFINPLANPDGTFFNHPDGSTVAESRRANINNIDLNRNFPTIDYSPTSLEPEILAMIEYSNKYPFTMSVNTHGGAEVANYPWDFWTSAENSHADDEWWKHVCTIYAGSAMANGPTAYFKGVSSTGITEGGDWYAVSGGRQDYMMFFKNCREMCLELSNTKLVQSENLPAFWNYNKEAMLLYTQQVLFGFGGTITDSIIGEPLEAKVFVNNHDRDNSHVFSHLPNGYYHRPIYEGEYQITYSAEGYKSKTITVNTTNNQFNRLDIKLGKLELYPPEAQFSSNFTANSCSPDITFINLTESSEDTEYLWYFGDGFTSNLKNPMHSYQEAGVYSVALLAENTQGRDSIMIENFINIQAIESPDVLSASSCGEVSSFTLSANGNGEIYWYENIDDINQIHIGNSFQTPNLSESKTYFAQDRVEVIEKFGPQPNTSDDGTFNNDDANHYLLFDTYAPIKIKSVKVVANSAGNRKILVSHLGNIVQTKEIYIPEGEQIIELDFDIPIGENFRLTCEGPANLYRGFSGYILPFGFPYKIDSYLEIKQSDDLLWWDDEKKYYPYFYDWEVILQSCASHRVPVYAIITNEAPIASFSYDNNLGTYNFYGLSENASNWEWDFGDGNFSDQQNPTHTYQANSTYTVKLTVSNQCGSSDYSEEINVDLSVEINDISKFSIYPNPSYDKINIENLKQGDLIEIYSNSGQKLYSKKLESSFITLDLMNLPKSSYVLRIISDSKVYNFKLVKI